MSECSNPEVIIENLLRRVIPEYWRPIGHLVHLTRQRTGQRVAGGPFAGLRYGGDSVGSAYIPKLLGIYEREIASCIESACGARPDVVVDIGAAEGYYACGMASRLPGARVIAFEMEAKGRSALIEMVRLNNFRDRVEIRGKCEPIDLEEILKTPKRPFVICDCEGYETVLLDPVAVPSISRASILVELHEFVERGITEKIRNRFLATHDLTRIAQEERARSDFPFSDLYTRYMPKSYLRWAPTEWRPEGMSWLWMKPKVR